ncbi:MAG: hypothetical protein ACUVTE_02465 [Candidatus Bathycorpusculaceae bacterium]
MVGLRFKSDLARFLRSSSILEKEVAKAYGHLATLVVDEDVKDLLSYIADDSLKHAHMLEAVSKCLAKSDVKVDFEVCQEVWGDLLESIIEEAKRLGS